MLSEEAVKSVCADCGAPFVCGAAAGLATCWCMQRPPLTQAPLPGGSCYCPHCLDRRSTPENDEAARRA